MSQAITVPTGFISREAYRAWCELQPRGRFERIDGEIVAQATERVAHARVRHAVAVALQRAIQAASVPCEAFPDGVTVEAGDNDSEPDAIVNCGDPIDGDATVAPNPVVVVEVSSPATSSYDSTSKLAGYLLVPSIRHYLLVHPTWRLVVHHRRVGEAFETTIRSSGPVVLDPPGITIAVEELYEAG